MVPVQSLWPSKFVELFSWHDWEEDCSLLDVPSKKSHPLAQDSWKVVIMFQSSLRCCLIVLLWGNRVGLYGWDGPKGSWSYTISVYLTHRILTWIHNLVGRALSPKNWATKLIWGRAATFIFFILPPGASCFSWYLVLGSLGLSRSSTQPSGFWSLYTFLIGPRRALILHKVIMVENGLIYNPR